MSQRAAHIRGEPRRMELFGDDRTRARWPRYIRELGPIGDPVTTLPKNSLARMTTAHFLLLFFDFSVALPPPLSLSLSLSLSSSPSLPFTLFLSLSLSLSLSLALLLTYIVPPGIPRHHPPLGPARPPASLCPSSSSANLHDQRIFDILLRPNGCPPLRIRASPRGL